MRKINLYLLEWVVVIIIVAIVATLIIFALIGVKERARDAMRLADMENFRQAMEVVNNEYGNYAGISGWCTPNSILSSSCNVKMNDPLSGPSCCEQNLTICKQMQCNYCFADYATDKKDYTVYFHLEKGANNFDKGGCYKLTKTGVTFVGALNK